MSVRIRLKRIGKNPKRRPFFRIAVFTKEQSRDSRSIEELGYYDPTKNPELIKINKERLQYWLSCGALMSQTVKSLVDRADRKREVTAEVQADDKNEAMAESPADVVTEDKTDSKAE